MPNIKPNKYIVIAVLLFAVWWLYAGLQSDSAASLEASGIYKATVVEVQDESVSQDEIDPGTIHQTLVVDVELPENIERKTILNDYIPVAAGQQIYVKGSFIGEAEENFYTIEVVRSGGLLWLGVFFVVLSIAIGGYKGLRALIGLLFSLAVIFSFIVPRILDGADPVYTSLFGAIFILIVALYVSHGINRTSIAAFIGIIVTLLFVGLLSDAIVHGLHFTGFGGEESVYLNQETNHILNFASILVAGIIIAVIGVLDDIAVTQASTVGQLAKVGNLRGTALFKKSMEVGHDHIAAVINTLVLAYVGAAMPLILLLAVRDFDVGFVLNGQLVSEEIIRTLLSSLGLLLAVPITTIVGVWLHRDVENREIDK